MNENISSTLVDIEDEKSSDQGRCFNGSARNA